MPHKILESYLRTYRKRAGFSQNEIAILLGSHTGSKISRYEHLKSMPNLQTAFGYEVIFHVPVHELFAGVFHKVENRVARRAKFLVRRMEADRDPSGAEKLALLEQAINH
jgi:transcriptional regulator with XRE-family HTH domain